MPYEINLETYRMTLVFIYIYKLLVVYIYYLPKQPSRNQIYEYPVI